MPVRQIDIAKKLGISRIAVSKALRDFPDISDAIKEKVRKTAAEMGYVPNFTGRNLQAQKTFTIGVVVPDISNSFFSFAIHGIMDAAREYGYHIILAASRESAELERVNIMNFLSMRVDGILIAVSSESPARQIYDTVKNLKVPLVFFDRSIPDLDFSSVGIDDEKAAFTLVDFVIQQGYTKIAHLAGSLSVDIGLQRYKGYIDALKKNGLPLKKEWVVKGGFHRGSGYDGFEKLYITGDLPQVIYAVNDRCAQGAYEAIRKRDLKIPQDIGVVAFGHTEFAQLLYPPLTIIDSPPHILGERALRILISEIEKPQYIQKVVLGSELKINASLEIKTPIRYTRHQAGESGRQTSLNIRPDEIQDNI